MNPTTPPAPIGGYFELELPHRQGHLYPDAMRLQSARASLLLLLQSLRPARIWMPWFNCPSMLEPVAIAGIPIVRYHIDDDFLPEQDIALAPQDLLLYVNYFGVCDRQVGSVLARFPAQQVILDYSQAFLTAPPACLATLYSPRKFFGLPDGAYLQCSVDLPLPADRETLSIARSAALLTRIDRSPEEGYAEIVQARQTFKAQQPLRMSALTERMLASIDYEQAWKRRQRNFAHYHARLQGLNGLTLTGDEVALCYPLRIALKDIRKIFQEQRIFVPQYWPGMPLEGDERGQAVQALSEQCLPLPCDQRYDSADIERVLTVLEGALAGRP